MIYWMLVGVVRLFNVLTGHTTIRHGDLRLPRQGGALVAINHTSYLDFTYIGVDAYKRDKRKLRFMGKVELKNNPVLRWLMWGCGVIPVDRSAGAEAYREAISELQRGELVGIYPEATISRSYEIKPLKSGAARMALEAGVPIIPAVVWGSQRIAPKGMPRQLGRTKTPVLVTLGEPLAPEGTADQLTDRLLEAMRSLLNEAQDAYADQPAGAWWVPASRGGSAPTLEVAEREDGR